MANSTTHLDTISQSQAQKEVTANALFDALSTGITFGRRASTSAGLTWGYFGGTIIVSGVPTQIANGTLALTPSATNYVRTSSAGVITVTTAAPSGWPGPLASNDLALYEIVCGASAVTSYTDYRGWWGASAAGGASTVSGITATTSNMLVGRVSQSPSGGTLEEIPVNTVAQMLPQFQGDSGSPADPLKGLVPAPAVGDGATKYLRADGTWQVPPGSGGGTVASTVATNSGIIVGRVSQSPTSGGCEELSPATVAAMLPQFQGDSGSPADPIKGLVPAPALGDGTSKFLRSDGTWAAPAAAAAKVVQVACSDLITALTTGTSKAVFRMPYAMTVTEVRASVATAMAGSPSDGITVDINEGGVSILSTKLSIDATEKTSTTAAVPAVISDSSLADDAEITIDIDAVGTALYGLVVTLIGT